MKKAIAGLAIATVLGVTGCAGGAEAAPAPTVTVTSEPVVEEVPVTPEECVEAIQKASLAWAEQAEVTEEFRRLLVDVAGNSDIDVIEDRIENLNQKEVHILDDITVVADLKQTCESE